MVLSVRRKNYLDFDLSMTNLLKIDSGNALPKGSRLRGRIPKEPEHGTPQWHLFFLVGGSPTHRTRMSEEAAAFGYTPTMFSQILRGAERISETRRESVCRVIIERHAPKSESVSAAQEFNNRIDAFRAAMTSQWGCNNIPDAFETAGRFMSGTIAFSGGTPTDIIPYVDTPDLKSPLIWQRMSKGDKSVSPALYITGLTELTEIYGIIDPPDSPVRSRQTTPAKTAKLLINAFKALENH
jgi:hypothetical protein